MATQYGSKDLFVTKLTDVTNTTDVEGLGNLRFEGGKVYKWVKTAVDITAGYACNYVTDSNTVTIVYAATVAANAKAGIAPTAITAATDSATYYFWLQVGGLATCFTNGSVALGAQVALDWNGTDGRVIPNTPGTNDALVIGVCPAADVGTVGLVLLQGLF